MIRRLAGVLGLVLVIAAAARAADVSALEQRARAFYALLEKGQRDRAAAEWPQLERDLMAADDQIRVDKDRIRKDLDADADEPTQAVQDPRLRQLEIESLIVSYHLAWVRYQGAQLVDDAGRKRTLLENAVDGFSKFTDMKEVPEVYAESLYGRGLAAMDLGDWANARQDLRAAAGLSRTAAKAKAALAEVDRKESGKPAEPEAPAEDPDQALLDKLAAASPRLRRIRRRRRTSRRSRAGSLRAAASGRQRSRRW